jgi:sugar phosphate isomerase/epimerase
MRLGLSGGPLPRRAADITPALAREVRALGFTGVTLHLLDEDPFALGPETCARIRETFALAGVRVVHSSGWMPCLIHPDETVRRRGLERLQQACRVARWLGAEGVLTGCGSLNPAGGYAPHPFNYSRQAFDLLVSSLRTAAPVAEDNGVQIVLESHVLTTLRSPQQTAAVIRAVDSPAVRANFDLVNYLTLETVYAPALALDQALLFLAPYVVSAHLKDVRVEPGLVTHIVEAAPGEGVFDLGLVLQRLAPFLAGRYMFIEHLPAEKVPAAVQAVRQVAAAVGLVFESDGEE